MAMKTKIDVCAVRGQSFFLSRVSLIIVSLFALFSLIVSASFAFAQSVVSVNFPNGYVGYYGTASNDKPQAPEGMYMFSEITNGGGIDRIVISQISTATSGGVPIFQSPQGNDSQMRIKVYFNDGTSSASQIATLNYSEQDNETMFGFFLGSDGSINLGLDPSTYVTQFGNAVGLSNIGGISYGLVTPNKTAGVSNTTSAFNLAIPTSRTASFSANNSLNALNAYLLSTQENRFWTWLGL